MDDKDKHDTYHKSIPEATEQGWTMFSKWLKGYSPIKGELLNSFNAICGRASIHTTSEEPPKYKVVRGIFLDTSGRDVLFTNQDGSCSVVDILQNQVDN